MLPKPGTQRFLGATLAHTQSAPRQLPGLMSYGLPGSRSRSRVPCALVT